MIGCEARLLAVGGLSQWRQQQYSWMADWHYQSTKRINKGERHSESREGDLKKSAGRVESGTGGVGSGAGRVEGSARRVESGTGRVDRGAGRVERGAGRVWRERD